MAAKNLPFLYTTCELNGRERKKKRVSFVRNSFASIVF